MSIFMSSKLPKNVLAHVWCVGWRVWWVLCGKKLQRNIPTLPRPASQQESLRHQTDGAAERRAVCACDAHHQPQGWPALLPPPAAPVSILRWASAQPPYPLSLPLVPCRSRAPKCRTSWPPTWFRPRCVKATRRRRRPPLRQPLHRPRSQPLSRPLSRPPPPSPSQPSLPRPRLRVPLPTR